MATEFEELSESLVDAFLETDVKKRRVEMDKWCKQAIPKLQAAIPSEIEEFRRSLESLEDETGLAKKGIQEKWRRIIVRLVMEVKVINKGDRPEGPLSQPRKSGDSWLKKLLVKLRLR